MGWPLHVERPMAMRSVLLLAVRYRIRSDPIPFKAGRNQLRDEKILSC